ncbi:MAG TPA: NAD-dependent epimerase/dehydratase family protein [Nocardioidaceae bacterium]|nr:NAD-dependent epimerase/dehydratase family protein [Nocardioidaceae bacterium]
MPEKHLVVGAGPVGRATAEQLVLAGHEVILASRSGTGPEVSGATRIALDAADVEQVTKAAEGARAIFNCVNPPAYDKWEAMWPPIAAALLEAAERTGALLVTASNLYAYGPVDGPMVEGMPDSGEGKKARLRATMWADALAAHQDGRIRAVEVRASDYMGPDVGDNGHIPRLVPRALAGKPVRVLGSPDQAHSWTDVLDMARALVAVAAREDSWGRVWHAPTNPPRTQREAVADVCRAAGREPVEVKAYPKAMLTLGGLMSPTLRELKETAYQFERPYVLDSGAISRELGLEPTPWDEVCRRTAGL